MTKKLSLFVSYKAEVRVKVLNRTRPKELLNPSCSWDISSIARV